MNTFFLVYEILHCPSYDCMQRVLFAKANLANPGNFLHLWQCTQRGGYDIHSHTHQLRRAEGGCSSGEPYTVLLTQKRPSFFVVVSYEAAFTASSSPLPPLYAVAFFPPILYIPADSMQRLLRLFLFYSCLRTISTVVRNTNECQNDTQLRPKFSLHCSSINCLHEILTIQKWFGIFNRRTLINKSIALLIHETSIRYPISLEISFSQDL